MVRLLGRGRREGGKKERRDKSTFNVTTAMDEGGGADRMWEAWAWEKMNEGGWSRRAG